MPTFLRKAQILIPLECLQEFGTRHDISPPPHPDACATTVFRDELHTRSLERETDST